MYNLEKSKYNVYKKSNVANTWQGVKAERHTWEERFDFFFIVVIVPF